MGRNKGTIGPDPSARENQSTIRKDPSEREHFMFKTAKILTMGLVMAIAGPSWASQIASFEPDPIANNAAEIIWDGTNLLAGPGMLSNGDGNSQAAGGLFTEPGIRLSTNFIINGVSSSSTTATSTTFYDTEMSMTGLAAVGTTSNFGGLLIQNLGAGTFTYMSSDDTTGGAVLLLTGNVTSATLSGLSNSTTGSVVSATVTYTAGLIFDELAPNGFSNTGSYSWSLIDIVPSLAIDPATDRLRAFSSNASGIWDATQASAIPVPAAFPAGLALFGVFGLLRRKLRVG